jgi:serine/threonine-protein kinase
MSSGSSGGTASSSNSWSSDPLIGRVLDARYRIEDVLGTGGVGVVYRAEHLKLRHQVAIKVLHDQLGSIGELRARFEREGQALSALNHPNIVAINDFGIHQGMPYLVMELLKGRTLADLIDDDGPPEIDVAIEISRQVLRGLAFAHDRGIVHRDLKAANVFLVALPDAPHHVKILDFGLAKIYSLDEESASDPTLTKSGTILGTPAYMSPEQAAGSVVDVRADVYSVGVLIFEILTGRYPFEAATRADMLRAHMLEAVPTLESARPGLRVKKDLEDLVQRAMSKERRDRFASAGAMLEALDALPERAATFESDAPPAAVAAPPRERSEVPTVNIGSDAAAQEPLSAVPSLAPKTRWALIGAAAFFAIALLVVLLVAVFGPDKDAVDPEAGDVARPPVEQGAGMAEAPMNEPPVMVQAPEQPPDPEPETEQPAVDLVLDEGALDELPVHEPPAVLPPARDPFASALPAGLRRYHQRVRRGGNLSRRDRQAVVQLQRAMPDDPRPSLVLAHHFVDIEFYSDAVRRYRRAFTIDPSCRGDPRMFRDLVRIAAGGSGSQAATDAVIEMYGRDSLERLDAMLERESNPQILGGLQRLRNRIAELPEPTP